MKIGKIGIINGLILENQIINKNSPNIQESVTQSHPVQCTVHVQDLPTHPV